MIRILHTSDWHLGATLEGVSRDEEHRQFLKWLKELLCQEQVEVLVVSGDVFDQVQPSAEAQRMYFGFLHGAQDTPLRQVVVVGGNHDSAARLDAPRELLGGLGVHVVGGLKAHEGDWERCICPIRDARGQVEAVALAVPFVHEYRLGVRTAMVDEADIRKSFEERFSAFYTHLTERALEVGQGATLLATGHLACAGGEAGDAPVEIHMAATLGGLPGMIFDPRLSYVALGHLHRMQRVEGSAAWYSGTPVALTVREAQTPRHVLLVDLQGQEDPAVRPVEVPLWRTILELRGEPEAVLEQADALDHQGPLPALLSVVLEVDHFTPGLEDDLQRAVKEQHGDAVELVRVIQLKRALEVKDEIPAVSLRELKPEDVFRKLCAVKNEPLDQELLTAFRSLLSQGDDEHGQERGSR